MKPRAQPWQAFAQAGRALLPSCPALALLLLVSACGASGEREGVAATETIPAATAGDPATPSIDYPERETVAPGENAAYNQRVSLIQRGHGVYLRNCLGCHGEFGDGKGPAAKLLITKPRDFTSGIYKFRSTDSGSLPMEADLHRTLTRGLARVSMPDFRLMPEGDKLAVIEYIKTFYPRWARDQQDRRMVPIPRAPADLDIPARIPRGRLVYLQMGCWKCHGTDGHGKGATQTEYVDAWGEPQKAFDFTRGSLKGGNAPEDIYRTFHSGLRSIMPAFGGDTMAAVAADGFAGIRDILEPTERDEMEAVMEQFPDSASEVFSTLTDAERRDLAQRNSWDLVAYILSLRDRSTTAEAVLGPGAAGP